MNVRRLVLAALLGAVLPACRQVAGEGDPVDVTYAASLTATMHELAVRFEARAGRAIRGDPRGSVAGAHLIREGVFLRDAYITADPATLRLLGPEDPGWAVGFARSEVVIAYSSTSRFAAALDSVREGKLEWPDVALRTGFRLGRTDPDLDPKGYRALFLFRLAERHFARPGLAAALLGGPSRAQEVFPEEHLSARVETGSLDAGVFYLAEARAHGLRALRLPGPLAQSDPGDASTLAALEYRGPDGRSFRGAPVSYAATIPLNSPDPKAAGAFIAFLLSEEGRAVLAEDGFAPVRVLIGRPERLPRILASSFSGP